MTIATCWKCSKKSSISSQGRLRSFGPHSLEAKVSFPDSLTCLTTVIHTVPIPA